MHRDSKENHAADVLMSNKESDEESSNSASAVELKTPISMQQEKYVTPTNNIVTG